MRIRRTLAAAAATTAAAAGLVLAAPAAHADPAPQCCVITTTATAPNTALLLSLLGLPAAALPQGQIGLTCNPIRVIAATIAATCATVAVMCENNSFSGVIALGCRALTPEEIAQLPNPPRPAP
ncbi:hydrophobin family protein [Nonomuraea sp. NPDC003214]